MFLIMYGTNEVELLAQQYPDMYKGDVLTGWIGVKDAMASMNGLDQLNVLTLLPKLCELSKRTCLDAEDCLKWIVAVSPHNMFVEFAISAYDLIKSDDRASLRRETLNDYTLWSN